MNWENSIMLSVFCYAASNLVHVARNVIEKNTSSNPFSIVIVPVVVVSIHLFCIGLGAVFVKLASYIIGGAS